MAKKRSRKKPRTVTQHLTSLERLVRTGFRQTDGRFRQVDARFRQIDKRFGQIDRRVELLQLDVSSFRKETNERFAAVEDQIGRLATHVDGFMKLHETMDIEMRVMKEQMKRFEERLGRVEAIQAS
jgi:archaellum component FlaC